MISELYIPNPPLDRFISHFFYFRGYDAGHAVERFLPDGEVQLVISLTPYPQYIYDNETLQDTILHQGLVLRFSHHTHHDTVRIRGFLSKTPTYSICFRPIATGVIDLRRRALPQNGTVTG